MSDVRHTLFVLKTANYCKYKLKVLTRVDIRIQNLGTKQGKRYNLHMTDISISASILSNNSFGFCRICFLPGFFIAWYICVRPKFSRYKFLKRCTVPTIFDMIFRYWNSYLSADLAMDLLPEYKVPILCGVCCLQLEKARVHYGGGSCYPCRAFFR